MEKKIAPKGNEEEKVNKDKYEKIEERCRAKSRVVSI